MSRSSDQSISCAGETLTLLPERAVFWARRNTLMVADLHLGKAATFRAAGLAVPAGGTSNDLARLDQALTRTGAQHLILLGDVLHARAGRTPGVLAQVAAWRARWPDLDITLVRGNHDQRAGDPPLDWQMRCVDEPWSMPPFALCHHPQDSPDGYVLAGHLHPAAQLQGIGRQQLRLACFWFGARVGVLPAFGGFTGSAVVTPARGDRVFVLVDDEVIPVAGGGPQ